MAASQLARRRRLKAGQDSEIFSHLPVQPRRTPWQRPATRRKKTKRLRKRPPKRNAKRSATRRRIETNVIRAPKSVSSEQNASFKDLRKLLTARGILEQGAALVAGSKVIPEVLARHGDRIALWVTREGADPPPLDVPWLDLAKPLFDELDSSGSQGPLVVVRVPAFAEWSPSKPWPRGCTLFIAMQQPDNVGALVRSAAAFSVARIVLLKEAAHPFHPKAMRAAGTALLSTTFLRGPSIKDLDAGSVPLLALDAGGEKLGAHRFEDTFGLLPGIEGPGVPAHLAVSARLAIPMREGVESLNAATAAAIALYAWRCQIEP